MSATKMKAATPPLFDQLPSELHVHILTYLRAYDLSALHQTCRFFASTSLVHNVIKHTAEHVYPLELTNGFGLEGKEYTFESLRNMEWLVVARVLSRPEPASGYYVSKSWCKTALKWLEVQQEEEKQRKPLSAGKKKKKLTKKQQRMRSRRLSDVSPPWPNVTSDLLCCHGDLQHVHSTKSARSKRRLLDKQAWKVLKKLYPDSVSLDSHNGECLECRIELEASKREHKQLQELEHEERRRPLSCPIVRGIYTRSRGVPAQSLSRDRGQPLIPGHYHVLPRAWLHQWRRYIKTGEGGRPCAPDSSVLLCDGHRLPLLPPHLEAYVYGETCQLLASVDGGDSTPATTSVAQRSTSVAGLPVGMSPVDIDTWNALRAAGISEQELNAQRALSSRRELQSPPSTPQTPRSRGGTTINELLDQENNVVVEILTDEEFSALKKWWPEVHSSFALRFSMDGDDGGVTWSTPPCRECDASGRCYSLSIRNRNKKAMQKSIPPASLKY